MNYQSTFTLSPPSGATGTWEFDSTLLPHPVNMMYFNQSATVGGLPVNAVGNFMNSQLAGVTHLNKVASFLGMAQRWRLAYLSVTCYQDGPDLSNQGTIVVSQSPIKPTVYSVATPRPWTGPLTSLECSHPVALYSSEDYPDFEASQAMPNAYFNRSREGAYVPLKLTKTCQQWQSSANLLNFSGDALGGAGLGTMVLFTAAGDSPYPHVNLPRTYCDNGANGITAAPTCDLMNDTVAHICARNLSVATSFSFFVRLGIEMQVVPTSTLAPQLKLSPMYDSTALKAYFMIARELKDGYPADYNDLGKIWDVISAAAKTVSPLLRAIPVAGPVLSAVVPGVAAVGDMIRNSTKGTKSARSKRAPTGGRDQTMASAADIERAKAITTARPAQGRRLAIARRQPIEDVVEALLPFARSRARGSKLGSRSRRGR